MIYLIDDDDIQNLINTRVISLANDQLHVQSFTSAEQALNNLESLNGAGYPKLIFLDINMPKMNGWDFLEEYEKHQYPVNIYMLSSSINSKDIDKSTTYKSVKGFISKPLVVEKLVQILSDEGYHNA